MMNSRFDSVSWKSGEYFPLKISVAYILITLLLSVAGPIVFTTGAYKKYLSIIYVGLVVIFFAVGYNFGLRIMNKYPSQVIKDNGIAKTYRLIHIAQAIALISIGFEFIYLIVTGSFTLNLGDVGATYLNIDRGESASIIIIFRFCTAFFRMAAVSLGFYYFEDLDKATRRKTIICALGILAIYLFGYGTQSGIGYLFIELFVAITANRIRKKAKLNKKSIRIIILIGVAILFLFAFMQYKRYDIMGVNAYNYHLRSTGEYSYNTDHIIFKIFGDELGFGLSTILGGYMSLGYYGLSLCMQIPFEWSYGIGNSYALTRLLEKIGITGILEKTYLIRMQEHFGRNGLDAWNSIFPWLASDFTWIGALFVFFLIGATLAFTWKDILIHRNAFSFLMFTTLMILIFFIPANNAIVHGYDNLMSTLFIVVGWALFRKRYMYE